MNPVLSQDAEAIFAPVNWFESGIGLLVHGRPLPPQIKLNLEDRRKLSITD